MLKIADNGGPAGERAVLDAGRDLLDGLRHSQASLYEAILDPTPAVFDRLGRALDRCVRHYETLRRSAGCPRK